MADELKLRVGGREFSGWQEIELRRSILDGRLGPGTVLPGIRSFARHLGVLSSASLAARLKEIDTP